MTFNVINAEKGIHHFLMTLKVFNTDKVLHNFLTILKVFNIGKELHDFLATPKSFNFEKWLHYFLMAPKVFQNNYSVECWWTAASEGHIFINELDLLWVPNFIALWVYIFFLGPIHLGMRELILALMSIVCYLAIILLFLVITWWLLLVT